jgi:hypothetical protein
MPPLIKSDELHDGPDDQVEAADRLHSQRAKLRLSLDEIASEVTTALQDAALAMPVFLSVPSTGALLTFMTPGDPPDEAWATVTDIICGILSSKIVVGGLIARPLACAASGALANWG